MPRVGGEFVAPFPPVVPDTTIESEVHNGIVADFVLDANNPRPVTAGGTGANSVSMARTNLQVERSMQVVTNYASHLFETGSFQSAAGATDSPPSGTAPHVGGALVLDANNIILYAWNVSGADPSEAYFWQREKIAGAWLPWYSLSINMVNYLPKGGGTMTGFLNLNANPTAPLHAAPKQYVDSLSAATGMVLKTGDTMSGHLHIPTVSATDPAHADAAVNRSYLDTYGSDVAVMKAGDTMSGYLSIPTVSGTDPTHASYAINRTYFDTHDTRMTETLNVLTARLEALERKIK